MAANRIGQLYQYTGSGSLPLWSSDGRFSYNDIGLVLPFVPFLILSKSETAPIYEQWIKVLIEEKIGWINASYNNFEWLGDY